MHLSKGKPRRVQVKTKNVFVSGPPRCGKTTLIEKLVLRMERPATGFFTREIRERGRRTGFWIMTLDGKKGVLAHEEIESRFVVGKYGVNVQSIDEIAVPSIIPSQPGEVVVIDEVGKMECCSPAFKQALTEILDSEHFVIGSIAQKGDPFIQNIKTRQDVSVVPLTQENRDSLELFYELLFAFR